MIHIDSQRYLLMLLLRGVIAIIFGILAIVWPHLTLFALVIIFGAYALVDGLVAMLTGLQNRHSSTWLLLAIEGGLGVVAGGIALASYH
jgi:uncharacterized membrane protein HdeD (DUF308 family)